ncbi:hypothetical protein [Mesorhizobium sp. M1365]|uniref:hypothetical protein n=1 Tax=Mesorhizobium sp. M1365 TaxID=2957090 RepID=UPI0033378B72
MLGKTRPGPETAHFIEHEAYKDISVVIPALRELHYVTLRPGVIGAGAPLKKRPNHKQDLGKGASAHCLTQ